MHARPMSLTITFVEGVALIGDGPRACNFKLECRTERS